MGVSGAHKLLELQRDFARLAAPGFKREIYASLVKEAQKQIRQGFVDQRDPYGTAWAPRKSGGRKKILRGEGKLMDSFTVVVTANGFRIRSSSAYAATHQFGDRSRGIPARRMTPTENRGLGPIWRPVFYATAQTVLAKLFAKHTR